MLFDSEVFDSVVFDSVVSFDSEESEFRTKMNDLKQTRSNHQSKIHVPTPTFGHSNPGIPSLHEGAS
jgi:hypothetical protein